jgi:hypothetical protein
MSDHALNLLEESHILRVAELIDRKLEQLRPMMKEKNLK